MKWILLITLTGALISSVSAEEPVKLLTIGNSFAANSTRYLSKIASAAGCKLIIKTANPGGCSLERHWTCAAAHEADPNDAIGNLYKQRNLKQVLKSDDWDVVTIQQLSTISDNIDTYRPYAKNLYEYIRKYAPDAEIMIHQTWAYRADDTKKYSGDYDQAAMHEKVRENYHTIAAELGVRIIPVGEAFSNARNHPDWSFEFDPDFDYETSQTPDLPNEKQSLCQGFRWKKDSRSFTDTHHAGPLGQYLGGAVFFEMLFNESVIDNSFRLPDESEEDILFLQQIAHDIVSDKRNTATQSTPESIRPQLEAGKKAVDKSH